MAPHSTNPKALDQRSTRSPRSMAANHGFTLVELLLVLALLVIIAGFTAAAMEGSLLQSKLRQGTERVRTAWSDARVQSVSGGQRLAFTCLVGGRDFRISACNDRYVPSEGGSSSQPPAPANSSSQTGQLPEGIVFRSARAAPNKVTAQQAGSIPAEQGQWSSPVVFNPDGTSYDAVLVLENEAGKQVRLALRGITCTAVSADVTSPGELR